MDHPHSGTALTGNRRQRQTRPQSPRGTGNARARIQEAALDLFIEEGYDRTSLREIAERLGLTKAAIYYHFPAKEDIANSLLDERVATLDELIEWAERQPDPERMRLEFVRRYETGLHGPGRHANITRFLRRNPTVIDVLPGGRRLRDRMRRVCELLTAPEDPPATQLRRVMALLCLHVGDLLWSRADGGEERRAAILAVALETMDDAARSSRRGR